MAAVKAKTLADMIKEDQTRKQAKPAVPSKPKPATEPEKVSVDTAISVLVDAEVEKLRKQNQAITNEHNMLFKHIDALLELVPTHDFNSCSDEKPYNHEPSDSTYCTRCHLLYIKSVGGNFEQFVVRGIELHRRSTQPVDPEQIRRRLKSNVE